MRENRRFTWVNARGKIIKHHVINIILNVLGGITVGNHLIISNKHVGFHALILHRHPVKNASKIMPQVQTPCWPISCKHRVFFRMNRQIGANSIGATLTCVKGVAYRSANGSACSGGSARCSLRRCICWIELAGHCFSL